MSKKNEYRFNLRFDETDEDHRKAQKKTRQKNGVQAGCNKSRRFVRQKGGGSR